MVYDHNKDRLNVIGEITASTNLKVSGTIQFDGNLKGKSDNSSQLSKFGYANFTSPDPSGATPTVYIQRFSSSPDQYHLQIQEDGDDLFTVDFDSVARVTVGSGGTSGEFYAPNVYVSNVLDIT